MTETLSDEVFLDFLRQGLHGKDALVSFCKQALTHRHELLDSRMSSFNFMWNHYTLVPIKEGMGIIEGMCRCIMHFFCEDLPLFADETTDLDVRKITDYNGPCIITKAG